MTAADFPLRRTLTDRKIGGVIGGFARHYGVDPRVARVIFLVGTLATFFWAGVVFYAVCLYVIPQEDPPAEPGAVAPGV